MGTSSSQRSPATPEWERVRELYRQPNPDPGEVAARIVQALDAQTRQGLADRGVAICLDTALVASKRTAQVGLEAYLRELAVEPTEPAGLQAAMAARSHAQDRIVRHRAASRFADLALDGLAVTVMDAASGGRPERLLTVTFPVAEDNLGAFYREGRLHELSQKFLGYDFDRVFRYFVSRDLSDFVGRKAFPDVGYAHRLLDAVALHCRRLAQGVPLAEAAPTLQSAAEAAGPQRLELVQQILRGAVDRGLAAIAAGGAV